MTHYYAELALWIAAMFMAGCPLGALARRIHDKMHPPSGDKVSLAHEKTKTPA